MLTEDAIPPVAESAQQDDIDVLQNFMKTLEGGLTKYDFEIDNDDGIPLFVSADTDSEAELDMKLYTNIDPLSPHH